MARPKKDYILLNMRVDRSVMERFNSYCDKAGQTKTMAFERIVSSFLDQQEYDLQDDKNTEKNNEQ